MCTNPGPYAGQLPYVPTVRTAAGATVVWSLASSGAGLVPLNDLHSTCGQETLELDEMRFAQSQDVGLAADLNPDRSFWMAARPIVDLVLDTSRARRMISIPGQALHSPMLSTGKASGASTRGSLVACAATKAGTISIAPSLTFRARSRCGPTRL